MEVQSQWFGPTAERKMLLAAGFKMDGGGPHQSKTMMLRELCTIFAASGSACPKSLIVEQNVLGKPTARARSVALHRLNQLYGLVQSPPICALLAALWKRDVVAQPLLAVLCALARDPPLRDASVAVFGAPIGAHVQSRNFAAAIEMANPGRFGAKMLKSLAQNCASTWTQAGFLSGKLAKVRVRPTPTPAAAAYAALLAECCGFGGPALLGSAWLAVTDLPIKERIALLQDADALGFLRLRTGGGIVEIAVRERMSTTLGLRDFVHI